MANRNEWIELGELSKKVKKDVQRLKIESQNTVSKKGFKHLSNALDSINEFRNQAENEMFSDGLEDVDVFFGNKEVPKDVDLFLEDFQWSGRIGATELYESYSSWSERKGLEILSSTAFGTEMSKRHKKIKNNRNYYLAEENSE